MKNVRRAGVLLLLVLVGVMAGCVPLPADANWGHLSIIDDRVAITFHDRMVLVDPSDYRVAPLLDADGQPRRDNEGNPRTWTLTSGGHCIPDCFYAAPLRLDDQTLLVASYNKKLLEVDLDTARIDETRSEIGGFIVGSPVMNDEFIYLPFSELNLVALNRSDYSVAWTLETERGVWAQPLLIPDANLLVVPSMDHNLYALDPVTGEARWTLDLGGAVGATPLLFEDSLYVGSFDGNLVRVNLNGEITAEFEGAEEWIWGTPAIVVEEDESVTLYAADTKGFVYALAVEADGFRELWRQKIAQRAIRATPIVFGDQLIVASRDHFVYWLDRTSGSVLSSQDTSGEVLADMLLVTSEDIPSVEQPTLVVLTMLLSPKFAVFNAETGAPGGRYDF